MSPGHQCESWTDDSYKPDDKEKSKEKLQCDNCYVIFVNAHPMKHIKSNNILGPDFANHWSCTEKCGEEPGRCCIFQPRYGLEQYRTKSKA